MGRRPRRPLAIPANCRACGVRELALCAPLDADEIAIVESCRAGHRVLGAGAELYSQGTPSDELFTVLDGWVVLYQVLEDGRRQILDFALRGAFLGFRPDFEAPVGHSAQCLTDVAVCTFARRDLMAMLAAHPRLALRMAWITARDLALASEHVTNLGRRSAHERTAYLLLELYARVRRAGLGDGPQVPLPLTQEHLADALGLTSVHVNRTLKRLRAEGLIDIGGGVLTVPDANALAEAAGVETTALEDAG